MRNEFDDKFRQLASEMKAQNEDRYKRFVLDSSEREKILKKQFKKLQEEFSSLKTKNQDQSIIQSTDRKILSDERATPSTTDGGQKLSQSILISTTVTEKPVTTPKATTEISTSAVRDNVDGNIPTTPFRKKSKTTNYIKSTTTSHRE